MLRKLSRIALAFAFVCAAVAPAFAAPVGAPAITTPQTTGVQQTLASAVAATTNQTWTSNALGRPKVVTLCLSASAATTFTVTESTSNVLFYQATLPDTVTVANYAPAGAGTLCENVTPASYISVKTSAAVTVSAEIQAQY